MRHLLALLPLLAACSSDPSPPSDATAGDVAAADASDAAGSGTCIDRAHWCAYRLGVDMCGVAEGERGGSRGISGCLGVARMCRPIPAPCWRCPDGSRIWRTEEVAAFAAAFADGGVCPPVDGGVGDPHF